MGAGQKERGCGAEQQQQQQQQRMGGLPAAASPINVTIAVSWGGSSDVWACSLAQFALVPWVPCSSSTAY